jgi:hypothetical protein
MVVSAAGGEFRDLIAIDEAVERDFHRPSLLPDGSSMLYVVDRVDTGADTIGVLSGSTRKAVLQLKGEYLDSPVYSPSGHLLYHRETTTPGAWAVPFSLERLEVSGAPFLVAPQGSWPTIGGNGCGAIRKPLANGRCRRAGAACRSGVPLATSCTTASCPATSWWST